MNPRDPAAVLANPGTQPYRAPRGPRPTRTPVVAGGPPPRKGRSAFFWVGLGCGGILLAGLLLGGGFAAFLWYARRGPVDAARGQLQQMKGGQLDQAYERFAQSYKARVTPEGLAAFVARHPTVKENADSTFMSWEVSGGTSTLSGYLTSASGARETVAYEMMQEGGAWKVSRLDVASDHPDTPVSTGPTGLRFDSVEAQKGASADGNVVVRLSMSVAGFEVRPQGDQFLMDLSLDVETLDPGGARVEALSRDSVLKVQRPTSLGKGAVAPIETTLTLDSSMPQGSYTIVLRVHDDFSGTQAEHRATVAMP